MTITILGGVSIHRSYIHQSDLMAVEETIKDEAQFHTHSYGRGALFYDAALPEALVVGSREVAYCMHDLEELLPTHAVLKTVFVKQLMPEKGDPLRKLPPDCATAVICPIGGFEDLYVQIADKKWPIASGDLVIIPHSDVRYAFSPFKGQLFLMCAYSGYKNIKAIKNKSSILGGPNAPVR